MAPLLRWTENESLRRTTLQVPEFIVAYNLFMNGVDRFDQSRSISATVRKERRVTMSILTLVLETSILKAHALLKALSRTGDPILDIGLMKQRIILQFLNDHVEYKRKRASLSVITPRFDFSECNVVNNSSAGSVQIHLENENRKSVHCVMRNMKTTEGRGGYTMYSYSE
eukprot:gb/GEZJ01006794.1/.p1 GENE.gb/GEZJ01006794.1/~~gb/GEZJ01006794.1/.p1  ORF type:complete len:170 (-),score=17.42 gb/GEZJ01006794.1/:209-718(-)